MLVFFIYYPTSHKAAACQGL